MVSAFIEGLDDSQENPGNLRDVGYMQVISIIWMSGPENQVTHLHCMSLYLDNFPCISTDILFWTNSK